MGAVTARHGLLVDTHALLWMLTDPGRIPDRTRTLLADRRQRVAVSAASAWEIATKYRLRKLPEAEVLLHAYEEHLDRLGVESLPISAAHSLLAGSLSWAHRDPFDRMIAAQCMVESVFLVTADPAFEELPGVRVIW